MKPILLEMNAFGPYKDKVELDFTKFGASSIFLISGPTGAGKTTIFDGISYALFNRASGENRATDMLKSQFATDEDFCYVDFTFAIGERNYRIKRNPTQMALGSRGRPVNRSADVEFYLEDQLIGQGSRDVDQKIEDILGLSYKQFRQIVLLPQGEFRELLLSSSLEKEGIFRDIFGTEVIQTFQDHLKSKAKAYRKAYEEYGTRLDQSLKSLAAEDDLALAEAIQLEKHDEILGHLKQHVQENKEALEQLKKEISQLAIAERNNERVLELLKQEQDLLVQQKELAEKEEWVRVTKQSVEKDKQAQEVKAEADRLTEIVKEGNALAKTSQETKEKLVELQKQLVADQEKLKVAKEKEATIVEIEQAIKLMEKELERFDDLAKNETEAKFVLKEKNDALLQMEQATKESERIAETIQTLKVNLDQLTVWTKEEKEFRELLSKEQESLREHTEKMSILQKIIAWTKELAENIQKENTQNKQMKKSLAAYEDARHIYFGNLAGTLAVELEDNQPCPVCGSIHHPHPASSGSDTMTKEELAALESQHSKDQVAFTKISEANNHKAAQIEEQVALLGESDGEYAASLVKVEQSSAETREKIEEVQHQLEKLEEKLANEEAWRKALADEEANHTKTQLLMQEQTTIHKNTDKVLLELEKEIKALTETLTHETVEEVTKNISAKQKEKQDILNQVEQLNQKVVQAEKEETRYQTALESLETQQTTNNQKTTNQAELFEKLLLQYDLDETYKGWLLADADKKAWQKEIEAFDKDQSYNKRELEKTRNSLAQFERVPTIEELEKEHEQIQGAKEEFDTKQTNLVGKISILENSYKEIKGTIDQSRKVLEPLKNVEHLSEIANGTSTRTNKVSFERYVLSIYFSEIILAANKRFEKMTNGRFELVRNEEIARHGAAGGLELNVFDRHSGQQRSVKSLSGGETFKASLALALGLSDVIQSQQGGVRVDTLFVDEGFGTLDADSLENAIETLIDLQASGRYIGIISHVDELKGRIPARIIVENKQQGSHARIEVDL